jgi:hypothetical protein
LRQVKLWDCRTGLLYFSPHVVFASCFPPHVPVEFILSPYSKGILLWIWWLCRRHTGCWNSSFGRRRNIYHSNQRNTGTRYHIGATRRPSTYSRKRNFIFHWRESHLDVAAIFRIQGITLSIGRHISWNKCAAARRRQSSNLSILYGHVCQWHHSYRKLGQDAIQYDFKRCIGSFFVAFGCYSCH